jgi:hypothetical protein
MKNIGFWILSLFFVIYIFSLIMYCCKGIKPIKEYIFNEMAKYGYINRGNNKNPKSNKILKNNLIRKNTKVKRKNINYPPIKRNNHLKRLLFQEIF